MANWLERFFANRKIKIAVDAHDPCASYRSWLEALGDGPTSAKFVALLALPGESALVYTSGTRATRVVVPQPYTTVAGDSTPVAYIYDLTGSEDHRQRLQEEIRKALPSWPTDEELPLESGQFETQASSLRSVHTWGGAPETEFLVAVLRLEDES